MRFIKYVFHYIDNEYLNGSKFKTYIDVKPYVVPKSILDKLIVKRDIIRHTKLSRHLSYNDYKRWLEGVVYFTKDTNEYMYSITRDKKYMYRSSMYKLQKQKDISNKL